MIAKARPPQRCAMAVWTDCAAADEAQFNEWYNRQHLTQRVAVPGFLNGARYVAVSGRPKYFALYGWAHARVGPSPVYMHLQDHPTRWTAAMMRAFRGTNRTVFDVRYRLGNGRGALAACIWVSPAPGREAALERALAGSLLPRLYAEAGLTGVTLLCVNRKASRMDSNESRMRAGPDRLADWVILVEGADRASVTSACARHATAAQLERAGAARGIKQRLYRLQLVVSKDQSDSLAYAADPPSVRSRRRTHAA